MAVSLFKHSFRALGGFNEVQIYCASENLAKDAFTRVEAEVSRIETKYSRYRPDSILSKINSAAGKLAVKVDPETEGLLNYADACFKNSNGLFDITSGVLRNAWNFKKAVVPQQTIIDEQLRLIGWQKVDWSPPYIKLSLAGMQLDFGGFGKEYAADRCASILKDSGIKHGFINLAGDITIVGPHPNGRHWMIGIQHPREQSRTLTTLAVYSGAVTTSGDYERFFECDGSRYCHILNPRTGYPAQGLQAVTIVATSCLVAGSLSTIAMLSGAEGALALLQESGLEFLMISEDGSINSSQHNNQQSCMKLDSNISITEEPLNSNSSENCCNVKSSNPSKGALLMERL